jgi:hypothetical protein
MGKEVREMKSVEDLVAEGKRKIEEIQRQDAVEQIAEMANLLERWHIKMEKIRGQLPECLRSFLRTSADVTTHEPTYDDLFFIELEGFKKVQILLGDNWHISKYSIDEMWKISYAYDVAVALAIAKGDSA